MNFCDKRIQRILPFFYDSLQRVEMAAQDCAVRGLVDVLQSS